MYPTSTSGLFCVRLAVLHNISAKRCHQTVIKAHVNIYPYKVTACKYKSQVVIKPVLYRRFCLVKGCPGFRGGRGSSFLFKGFHRDFGIIPGTHPLGQFFQFFWYSGIIHYPTLLYSVSVISSLYGKSLIQPQKSSHSFSL